MNKKTAHILWFKNIRRHDIPLVGGKGANLGEMVHVKIPVPDGFCVTAKAYYDFIKSTSLKQKILTELKGLDVNDSDKLHRVSKNIKAAILRAKLPDELAEEIRSILQVTTQNDLRKASLHGPDVVSITQDSDFIGGNKYYTVTIDYEFKRFD